MMRKDEAVAIIMHAGVVRAAFKEDAKQVRRQLKHMQQSIEEELKPLEEMARTCLDEIKDKGASPNG